MAIDPTKILMQVYSKVTEKFLKQIFFIYSPKINPKVVEKYPGNRYSIWTKGGIGSDIKNTCDVILDAGGNVSISLIRLLYLIGIRKFVLVGQDFAWKGTRTHSNGHHGSNNHIQFDPNKYIELKNIYGETIYSSKAYLAAARELESDIRKYNLEVYNLYGGGINISGTKNIKIEDLGLIADNKNKSELEELLSDLKSQKTQRTYIPRISFESKQWISSLNSFQKRLDKLYKKPNINTNKIRSAYNELHIFLTQHPLYKYCIYNEVLELSRYVFIQEKYDLSDLAYTKKIINDIKKQLPKIDKILKEQLTKIKDHFTEINDVCNRHIAA